VAGDQNCDRIQSEPTQGAIASQTVQALERSLDLGCVREIHCFSVNKAGSLPSECEDVYQSHHQADICRIGLADGATESSFAKEWARQLVGQFVMQPILKIAIASNSAPDSIQNPTHNYEQNFEEYPLGNWLAPLQQTWATWLAGQDLLWFAKRKAEQGTYATLLGLEIEANYEWQAIAVGDSCLFVVRAHQLLCSFPLQHSHEFGYRPRLLGTIPLNKPNDDQLDRTVGRFMQSKAEVGDRFYLATDALAAWILCNIEKQENPWVELDHLHTQAEFLAWINTLRDRQAIVNDDTTLIRIQIE
jgi:hypothetical protein